MWPFCPCCYCELFHLWQLVHSSQATSTDIDCTPHTIDFDTTALYIQHKASSSALLRKINIIAIHRLAFAYLTTTRHITLPLYFIYGLGVASQASLDNEVCLWYTAYVSISFVSFSIFDEKPIWQWYIKRTWIHHASIPCCHLCWQESGEYKREKTCACRKHLPSNLNREHTILER